MKKKNQNYIVHKFGGSSLANAERFTAVKSLLSGRNEIIVVSAIKETTSLLQTVLDQAKEGQWDVSILARVETNHLSLIESLLPAHLRQDLFEMIRVDFADIKSILHGVQLINSYSPAIQDVILGYGEQWSAKILTAYLGLTGKVSYLDAATVVFIYHKRGTLYIDWEKTQAALDRFLADHNFDQLVVTGFIATTLEGRRTTLGRNGSDFSAAIMAKLFEATSLYIWTDVDGIFTADPERVRSAFAIEALSYKEALELAYFGAKVLHPMTIAPALEKHIPIYIKNSLKPSAPGTTISSTSKKSPYLIKALTSIDDIALINIEGAGMIGVSGIAARVFDILQQEKISVILISQASSEYSICFAIANQYADTAVKALHDNLQFEMESRLIEKIYADKACAILAVIGDEMIGTIGVSGKLCGTLAKANINIRAIAQGSSERNISVVINKEEVNKALQAVHAGFYLSNKTMSIGLIGPGIVGSALLQQIHETQKQLKSDYQVSLCVRGIMNSKKMLLAPDHIELETWPSQLNASTVEANLQEFANHILSDNVPHAVIIDCTASPGIASHYVDFIAQGIDVITPNKQANGGDLAYYQQLKSLVQQKNRYYLYEATVCAGLPVINTLQDLIKTGDEIVAIEGVVSGTLSYIFSELAKGRRFSEVVLEAKQHGYTEPDPREDLSGKDVARKLLCLAREMGHEVSMQDVKVHNLVPKELLTCSVDEFLSRLPDYDDQMTASLVKANAKGERLYYVGAVHQDGSLHVEIASFKQDHPFTRLQGTDNMLIFHTRRYHQQPLIIQGPGAGAEVTASGIFADLLRLVSFLA